jgi:hypothetical protein
MSAPCEMIAGSRTGRSEGGSDSSMCLLGARQRWSAPRPRPLRWSRGPGAKAAAGKRKSPSVQTARIAAHGADAVAESGCSVAAPRSAAMVALPIRRPRRWRCFTSLGVGCGRGLLRCGPRVGLVRGETARRCGTRRARSRASPVDDRRKRQAFAATRQSGGPPLGG